MYGWEGGLMNRQTEFFRKIHPEQFSDSQVLKVGLLDKDYFGYFMETLTNQSREKEFETFCRRMAEAEICPNLLPQTGPTGGGDSKVDSETYPVAENKTETWYYGEGDKASKERWAFAMSAKKAWKPKIESDVKKIADVNRETGRGYTKIFFMSNQFISDKKRAEEEDKLRLEYQIDIRILDRTWFIEKVFSGNNKKIAVECFNLSVNFIDQVDVGTRDYDRIRELESIEKSLDNSTNLKEAECISLASKSVVLARELEIPKERMIGILERNKRLAKTYGSIGEIAKSIYDYSWTVYWWYADADSYYKNYQEYEKIAQENKNIHFLNQLTTLWTNLFSLVISGDLEININKHTENLVIMLKKFIEDKSKPNSALEAREDYQRVRVLLGDDVDDIIAEYLDIIKKSDNNLNLDLYPIKRIITEIPVFHQAKRYDEVFELLVDKMSKLSQDASVAEMLISRGKILEEKKPYDALAYYSRALNKVYNENSKDELIITLVNMAIIFERVGLYWAARNFYMYVFCMCLNQYMNQAEVHPGLILSANYLKMLELQLGRIIYATEFDFFEKIARRIYPKNIEEKNDLFDYILGMQLFRTEFSKLVKIQNLPTYLEKRDLFFAGVASKYELGHYDDENMKQFGGIKEAYDDFIEKWYNQPARGQMRGLPWFGFEKNVHFKSKILGCTINIKSCNNAMNLELATTILASLESFFVTGIQNNLIPLTNRIDFEIEYLESKDFCIRWEKIEGKSNCFKIHCSDYMADNIVESQKKVSDFLIEILSLIVSILFPYEEYLSKIKNMILDENALGRSQVFANSIFYALETLGKDIFDYDEAVKETEMFPLIRSSKVEIVEKSEDVEQKNIDKDTLKIVYDKPPKEDFNDINQEDIHIDSVINVSLWNRAEWKGVMFLAFSEHTHPPVLAPVYMKIEGLRVFEEWIEQFGTNDINDEIRIAIIKGINKEHPYWYRVIIGSDITNNGIKGNQRKIFGQVNRTHTMEAQSDRNLKMFEEELKNFSVYAICPATTKDLLEQPKIDNKKIIYKRKSSITICNAWEIKENDLFMYTGIMPDDKPIIPKEVSNPPILKLIEKHKQIRNTKMR